MCNWSYCNFRSDPDICLNGPCEIIKYSNRSPDRDFKPVPSEHGAGTGSRHPSLHTCQFTLHNYAIQVIRELLRYSRLPSTCSAYVPCRRSSCNTVQRDCSGPRSVCRWTCTPQPAMLHWALVFTSLNMYTSHCKVTLGISVRDSKTFTLDCSVITLSISSWLSTCTRQPTMYDTVQNVLFLLSSTYPPSPPPPHTHTLRSMALCQAATWNWTRKFENSCLWQWIP
jgi:hypothetical protein